MEKIQKVSRLFKVLFFVGFILIPIFLIVFWIGAPKPIGFPQMGATISFIDSFRVNLPMHNITKLFGFLISLIPIGFLELTLYFLFKLFRLYENGEIFSLRNVTLIKKIGFTLLIGQLVDPIYQALMTLNLSWYSHPKYIAIGISGVNIGIILTGCMVILISWIMAEGYRLREEQELTV